MKTISRYLPAFVILVLAVPVLAQYMYLDTDGDGVHSGSDVVNPSGPTAVDVWLATDVNRDGSPATCLSADGDLSISGYEFILHASNGTLLWSAFTNHRPEFGATFGEASSGIDYHNGQLAGTALGPGKYRLASLTVEVASGTPSVAIIATTPLNGFFNTSFTSSCSGIDFDNMLKLGGDWADADGIPYGGASNNPPVLGPLADMTVAEGATASQRLVADDPDGDVVTLRLVTGPSYAALDSLESAAGHASGTIVLTPGLEDAGTSSATIEASDAVLSDRKTLGITVSPTNRAPTMLQPADVTMREGVHASNALIGDDADQDLLDFQLVSGPAFASVTTDDRTPRAFGRVNLDPGFTDAGTFTVTVSVTDGSLSAQRSFSVTVNEGFDFVPPILAAPVDMTVRVGATAEQTLRGVSPNDEPFSFALDSGPAFASVSTISSAPDGAIGRVHLAPGPGDAGVYTATISAMAGARRDNLPIRITVIGPDDPPPIGPLDFGAAFLSMEVGNFPEDATIGDLDGDGHEDLVSADLFGSTITLLFGEGDGSFPQRQTYNVGGAPFAAAIGDVDKDGKVDIAFVDSTSYIVTILRGRGSRLFGERTDYRTGTRPAFVTMADLSGDGWLDLVVPNEDENTISVLLGLGDGTFAPRVNYVVGVEPCQQSVGDLNGDGILDIVVVNEGSNSLSVLLGTGGGGFGTETQFSTGREPRTVEIGDLSGDGIPDLAVPNFEDHTASVLLGVGGGRFGGHVDYPTGRLPWGLALGDFDEDGRLDVATANAATSDVSIFLGDGSGGLSPRTDIPTGYTPRTVRSKDMNHDGHIDLVVDNENANTLTLLTGNGDGTFGTHRTLAEGTTRVSIATGDINGDGVTDFLLPKLPSAVSVFLGLAGGGSAPPFDVEIGAEPSRIVLADWNADGSMDIAVTSLSSHTVTIRLGQGGTSFGPATAIPVGTSPFKGVAADLNADGRLDLIVGDPLAKTFHTLSGRGDGTFEVAAGPQLQGRPHGIAIADWNGDGIPDVVACEGEPGGISLFLGSSSGGLTLGTRIPIASGVFGFGGALDAAIGDLEGDGLPDLVAVTSTGESFNPGGRLLTFQRGNDGTPAQSGERVAGEYPEGVVLEDLNGDGLPEAIVSDTGPRAVYIFNGGRNGVFGNRVDIGPVIADRVGVGDLTGDGIRDLVVATSLVRAYPNRAPRAPRALPARAFVTSENLVTRLANGKPTTCVQVEPMSASFLLGDVDPASLTMRSSGTGEVEEIAGTGGKSGDRDKNGIADMTVCFAQEALRRLFSNIVGSQTLPVKIRGRLRSGERLEAALDLKVAGGRERALRVSLGPNPLNPTATLTVETPKAGPLRVRVFDAAGRLVRTLADERLVPAGIHALRVDAGGRSGSRDRALASGIYFYHVETVEEMRSGRMVIVK